MARPIEKTHRLPVDTIQEMRTAYGTPECLAHALRMHVADVRRMLRGEGLRPEEHAELMERWTVMDPHGLRVVIRALFDQIKDDRATVAEISFVEVDELRHFFNALFPHMEVT